MDLIKAVESQQMRKDLTPFNVGDTIRVHYKVIEGDRERIQPFEGIVIKKEWFRFKRDFHCKTCILWRWS